MKNVYEDRNGGELEQLCASVRASVTDGDYVSCVDMICRAMAQYPDAPQPHNLLGILQEKSGDHAGAMRHFRAAWALDPGYRPANHNLYIYGTFYSNGKCAFDESDVPAGPESTMEIVYDQRGVGHVRSKWKIEYDEHGIGHGVRR